MPIQPDPTPAASQFTWGDIIKRAMRAAHVLEAGEEPDGTEAHDAVVIANQMLDGWNAERLMIYTITIQDFALTAGKQVYAFGADVDAVVGDFKAPRPSRIERASIVLTNTQPQPIERPIHMYRNDKEWQRVTIKSVPSTFPLSFYDDGSFPARNLSFWPVPVEVNTFRCYSWSALQQFSSLTDAVIFPPGYAEAIVYNLAVRIAAEWPGELSQGIVMGAQQALARIRVSNVGIQLLECDDAFCGSGQTGSDMRANEFNLPY